MSVQESGSIVRRATSPAGFTSTSRYFVMDWAAVWRDIFGGLRVFFLTHHPLWAKVWGPLVGPAVAVVSFVCSIGNVPLAAVLWNGGISFGGVISFIFADLIIIPILLIYRKYYGTRMALRLFATFYATMVAVAAISWNYTTWLNIAFLLLAAGLVWRFLRTGGLPMLKIMGGAPDGADHEHGAHAGHRPHPTAAT